MKEEVDSATSFLAGLIANKVPRTFLDAFKNKLTDGMYERYENHWHPQRPNRGSAYRSIAIHYDRVDDLIDSALVKACQESNFTKDSARKVGKHFPQELTLWVDPMDVSYRIGDNGSIGVVYSRPVVAASDSDSEGSMSSSACNSPSTSPCSSPVGSPPRPASMAFCTARTIPQQCRQQTFVAPYYRNGLQMVYS